MLIQRRGELLSRPCQLLSQVVRLQGKIVPFVLKCRKECRNRRQGRGPRSRDARRLDRQQVLCCYNFAVGFCAMFADILFYEPLLVYDAFKDTVSGRFSPDANCNSTSTHPTSWTRQALVELLRRLDFWVSKDATDKQASKNGW